jgi:5-methylcytosine-specific restriction enzyme A
VPPQGNTVGTVWDPSDQKSISRRSVVDENFERDVQRAASLSAEDREARMRRWPPMPEQIEVTTTVFVRSPYVVAAVRERANGFCEDCEQPAPFVRNSDGTPYLEVHHVQPLAQDGPDIVENAIATNRKG